MKALGSVRRFWLSIPAPNRRHIVLWFGVLFLAGFFLPDHWSTSGGMARATDSAGRRWYVELEDDVAFYYGQPWSHTIRAIWRLASSPPAGGSPVSGPLTLSHDPPNATGRLVEPGEGSAVAGERLNQAAVDAARSPSLTSSTYLIDWRGGVARMLVPFAAVSALMLLVAFACRRDRPKLIAAGICPECTYPLVACRGATDGSQCPECGVVYK